MRSPRHRACFGIVVLASAFVTVHAQQPPFPRTPEGKPNLEGIWTAGTLTAFERPPQFAGKAKLSAEEVGALQDAAKQRFWAAGHRPDDVGRDNDAFIDDDLELLTTGQTSLVVRPENGIVPLTPEAERLRDININTLDSYETMSQWDRCITREPTTLFSVVYNNAYQVVQTPSHVLIAAEMVHDARVIPLTDGPRIHPNVRSWAGDARGRWEGDTLVVETSHFKSGGWIATGLGAGRVRGVPFTERLRTYERFTPVDRDTLQYEITIEDPAMYTATWTVSYPLKRDDAYQIFEYACHEGNAAVELMLRGARVQEAQQQK